MPDYRLISWIAFAIARTKPVAAHKSNAIDIVIIVDPP